MQNTAAVLRALRQQGASTRAELAKQTGLAKATISVIVADLEAAGAVAEGGSRPGVRGRPGRAVGLRGDRFVGLGLELNVDYVSAVVLDLAGRVLLSESRPAVDGALLDLARDAVAEHAGRGPDRRRDHAGGPRAGARGQPDGGVGAQPRRRGCRARRRDRRTSCPAAGSG